MIQISDELRAKIQRGKARTHAKLVIDDHVFGYDNKNETAPPKDDGSICKLEFEYNLSEDDFAIGTACSNMCEVILYGAQNLEFEGKYVKAYIGYELDETFVINGRAYPKIEWVPMGTFLIHDIIKKGPLVSFSSFDRMDNLSCLIYVPSSLLGSHPKAYNVFMDIFSFASIPYNAESFYKIMNFTVDMSLLYGTEKDGNTTGYSVREALAYLAGRAGGCVIINRYDEMQFVEYSFANINETVNDFVIETEYLITDNDVADFEVMGDGVHGMKYIECAYSEDVVRYEDSTTEYKNGIALDSPLNKTVDDAKAILDHINNIYRHHGGIFYMTPCYFRLMNGDVSIEPGDIISYAKNRNFAAGTQAYIPIMHIKIKYTGKPDIQIESYSKSDAEHLNRIGPVHRSFTAFKRVSDNNYKYLDEAFKTVSNQIMGTDGGYIVVDKNEDGTWRQMRVLDKIENPGSMIVLNKNGIGFSNDGSGNITSAAITIDGKIVANSMTGGVLQAAQGYIGDWMIDRGETGTTYNGGLYSDYVGGAISYRVFLQRAYIDKGNDAHNTWVFSTQKADVKNGVVGGYSGTYIVYADGRTEHNNDVILNCKVYDNFGNEILNPNSGNLVVLNKDFSFGKESWNLDSNTALVERNTFNSSSNLVISANHGTNIIYLAGSIIRMTGNTSFYKIVAFNDIATFNDNIYLNYIKNQISGSSAPLYVMSNGVVGYGTSSKRYKENITDELEENLNPEQLYDLPVVQYNYKEEFKDKELVAGTQIGITAEDVDKHYPNACIYNKDGQPESWQDRIMIPAMLKLIQEQKQEIDSLKAQLKEQNERLTAIENLLNK